MKTKPAMTAAKKPRPRKGRTELAKYLAREIIQLGDLPLGKCYRIEFKIGSFHQERSAGGLCETALEKLILDRLDKIHEKPAISLPLRGDKKK